MIWFGTDTHLLKFLWACWDLPGDPNGRGCTSSPTRSQEPKRTAYPQHAVDVPKVDDVKAVIASLVVDDVALGNALCTLRTACTHTQPRDV